MTRSRWIVRTEPRPAASQRLVCVPHAGGGASGFAPWARGLPAAIELCAVQAPGRETRFHEAPCRDLAALVEAVGSAVLPLADRPLTLMGHSFGALVAHEVTRWLAARGQAVRRLVVSGAAAPQLPRLHPPVHAAPAAELVAAVAERYGGIPAAVLADRELLELCLPPLRADLEMLERHECRDLAPLSVPIVALAGDRDRAAPLARVQPWRERTTGEFALHVFAGGHFFIRERSPEVLDLLARLLLDSDP